MESLIGASLENKEMWTIGSFGWMSSGVAASALIIFGFTLTMKSASPVFVLLSQAFLIISMLFSCVAAAILREIDSYPERSDAAETSFSVTMGLGLIAIFLGLLLLVVSVNWVLSVAFIIGTLSLFFLKRAYNDLLRVNSQEQHAEVKAMKSFEEFKRVYMEKRSEHSKNKFYTLSGFFLRLIGSEKCWERFLGREVNIARFGLDGLSGLIRDGALSLEELDEHRLALKNTNSTLERRGSFILVFISCRSFDLI